MNYILDDNETNEKIEFGTHIVVNADGEDKDECVINDDDVLDVLPLRNKVMFPNVLMPISVSRPQSLKLIKRAHKNGQAIAVLCQRNKDVSDPTDTDLYTVGTAARVINILPLGDNRPTLVILHGIKHVDIQEFITQGNNLCAKVHVVEEDTQVFRYPEFKATYNSICELVFELAEFEENGNELKAQLKPLRDIPKMMINTICSILPFDIAVKQKMLEDAEISLRCKDLIAGLSELISTKRMQQEIRRKTEQELNRQQREYFLHQQMQTIQRELGDTNDMLFEELQLRASLKNWPKYAEEAFEKELKKLRTMPQNSPDFPVQQNYIDTLLSLPWNDCTDDNYDLIHAQKILDRDHYGLEKVKERIVEYLAVQRQLSLRTQKEKDTHPVKSPILCLYGPPGVGKTSLGKSVAEALGRKYARISLGGLHDEAEIRGHRRTYVGAMAGRIIEGLKKVESSNPVFVLDEIDKIGADYKGDPTSALLEVLDPEQNNTFHDNYLNLPYDLSKVLFIATANTLDSIPRPLLDRMELIEMTGYLQEEKEQIAKRYLLPKQLKEHGLKSTQLKLKKEQIGQIIEDYTRESGVRSLNRQIATICRKVDTRIALEQDYNVTPTREDIVTYLGKPRFSRDSYETNRYIGVVTGLAWTQVGGEILFIESSLSKSKTPQLTLTGNLGDVMKESATIALAYIKSHADDFGIKAKDIETQSVHIHVPEGAIPKDGPSAGITMTTALVSAFTHRKVRQRIAMTGEMTLRGKVLPIGGVKEKILAAKRAGITDLVLCQANQKDVEDIPEIYLRGLRFHYVKDIQEVIDFALLK